LESVDVALVFLPAQRFPVLSPLSADGTLIRLTPSAQDLNSSSTSTFPRAGLTSAYPRRYPGPSLLEPSYSLAASGRLPAHPLDDSGKGFPRSGCPFCATSGRCSTPCPSYRADTT
jgi:hypothetical protein